MLRISSSQNKCTAFFLILLLCFSLWGCCENKETAPDKGTISFTDDLGRKVTLSTSPERVAALLGSFADVWLLSGGTLSAAPEDAWSDFGLKDSECVNLGGAHSPSLETLIASEPDFVIGSASTSADVEMLQLLEKMNIPVAYFDVDCFDDYLRMLNICTDITGRKDLYKQNGTDIKEQIEGIINDVHSAGLSEEKKTVLLLRASSGFVKAKGSKGTVLGEMLKDLGCINIADSDTLLLEKLSIESIVQSEPYHIFVVTMGDDTAKAEKQLNELLSSNPLWKELRAVKEKRLHIMDRKMFNLKPNAKWAESYEELRKILLEEQ